MLKTYFLNSAKLPLVIESADRDKSLQRLDDLLILNREYFQKMLLGYGALLLRGFQAQTIGEFQYFVNRFSGKELFNYAGGVSPRVALNESVYTSTEYPPEITLDLHNELSYSNIYPEHLYFFCLTAPQKGGETTLGDSRQILRTIRPKITGLFKHKKVLYERNLSADKGSGYSWQEAFETDDKKVVEKICLNMNADFEWLSNEVLRIKQICPATVHHPKTGEEVWFNQSHGFHSSVMDDETHRSLLKNNQNFRLNSYFGDGSNICGLMIEHIREVLRNETIPLQWQNGDILVLDNMLTAHGRMPFSGSRKIAVAMT